MSTHILKQSRIPLLALLLVMVFSLNRAAWAHGGVDDEKPEPAAAASGASTSNATQTDLELHLEDLNASVAGTSVPLVGAKVRGFLKHDDGDLLSRITVTPEKTPGYYQVHFSEDAASYRFSEAGKYFLELNVQPAKGDVFNTTVNFELPRAAPPAAPLWRRVLPFVLGALAVGALLMLVRRRGNPSRGKPTSAPVETVTTALLFVSLGTAMSTHVARAHGGVDDEKPEPPAAAATGEAAAPNIALGQTSTTTKAGAVRITLIARTQPAAPETLAPGEVQLPSQTAQLLNIKTQPVQVAQLSTGINFSGQIAANPNGTVRVASIVPGRVTRLNVAQGDAVRQGQVVAIVESRAVGEAQSAYQQALARLGNAQTNLGVVQQQARAGVFSRAPLDVARRTQAEAAGDVRQQEAAVQQARVALDNVTRLARLGGFANPSLEAARRQAAEANESLRTAQAALTNARAATISAQSELARRRQLAASGSYQSRPVEEARRSLVAAQSARAASQSEVATTRANLSRARSLASEGLVSQRDLEASQQAYDTATARLETAQADERAAQQELERQGQVAGSNVNNVAEVQAAQSTLASARADVRTRGAEVEGARTGLRLANAALSRERAIFGQNIANRREIGTARANIQAAQAGLYKARRVVETANLGLQREQLIFRRNLNNLAQVQQARAGYVSAQADLRAAQSTLSLLKSSPGGSVAVPIRAPMSGVVQTRDVAPGELVGADAPILTIVNLASVALEASLFEADFARVRIGSRVSVSTDAVPNRSFIGRIGFLGSSVDPQTRTVTARALIDNPGNLRPGMFARGQVQTGVGKLSIAIPESSVLDDGAAKVVFVAKGDKYERREVSLGNASNGRVEIKSGLKQGEEVVTEGAGALRAQAAKGA